MEAVIKNLIHVLLSVILSLSYCYFFSSKLQSGTSRLISLLPILCFFTIIPLYLSSAFLRAVTAFFITWLTNSNLLLFAFNQGPLISSTHSNSLSIFIISATLPIKLKQNFYQTPGRQNLPFNLGIKILGLSLLVGLTINYRYEIQIHPQFLLVLLCFMLFLLANIAVALLSFLVHGLVGLELEPPSNEPYLSASLQEFWGKRWNPTVSNTLRETVYKPIRSISTILVGKDWSPLPAVLSVFLVSGLMHELIYYYVTLAKPSWEITLFFVLQGVGIVLEFGIKMGLKGMKLELPWFVSVTLMVGFLVITSFWLYFPPLVRNGVDAMILEEFMIFGEFVKNDIVRLFATILGGQNSS